VTTREKLARELARWGSSIKIWVIPALNNRRVVMPATADREADRIIKLLKGGEKGG